MLQIDMPGRPLDGLHAELTLVTWSYGRLGDRRLLWPEYLAGLAAQRGVEVSPEDVPYTYSDNSSFGGFDVPNADLIYEADALGQRPLCHPHPRSLRHGGAGPRDGRHAGGDGPRGAGRRPGAARRPGGRARHAPARAPRPVRRQPHRSAAHDAHRLSRPGHGPGHGGL